MGKRKNRKAPPKKIKLRLQKEFDCPLCCTKKSIKFRINHQTRTGCLLCQYCEATYSTTLGLNDKAIDVFAEWIDVISNTAPVKLLNKEDGTEITNAIREKSLPRYAEGIEITLCSTDMARKGMAERYNLSLDSPTEKRFTPPVPAAVRENNEPLHEQVEEMESNIFNNNKLKIINNIPNMSNLFENEPELDMKY